MNDVIITGAGASAADGAPIQTNLFRSFWEKERDNIRKARMECKDVYSGGHTFSDPWYSVLCDLDRYFRSFFGIDVAPLSETAEASGFEYPTFEEALGVLDLALANREDFYDFQQHEYSSAISTTYHNLVLLIASLLTKTLPEVGRCHGLLVDSLHRAGRLPQTTFVTLNYDCLLDSALEKAVGVTNVDYAMAFRSSPKKDSQPQVSPPIRLLKLHGSLDWLYCACCRSVDRDVVTRVIPGLSQGTPFCGCGNVKKPIILPPTFLKTATSFHLQHLWATVEDFLANARRLIFCGYSFPDADLNFKYLLKRAQLRAQAHNNSYVPGSGGLEPAEPLWTSVIVINNHRDKAEAQRKEEAIRYKRFFGANVKVAYTDLSFEDFAHDCTIVDLCKDNNVQPS